ncbi:MAG: hypothetical protein C5B56_08755 [Proteobacteria bacterium]|nr:MAG: hypothetical protein C5B56_08755 [Pseudomonadota bacterium]
MEELKRRYGDRVEFAAVYVREAHPTDGWRMSSNDDVGIRIKQPCETGERVEVARRCKTALKISMPLLVDELDDRVGHMYSGMPDRLYLIDRQGRIAYKGGRGPFGFKPGELEQALLLLLVDQEGAAPRTMERLPMLPQEDAWRRLPGAPATVQRLPAWARMLAGPLPATTARMLELDALHRTGNRLDPKLRGLARWSAADANRCDYAKTVAVADLRRDGIPDAELQRLLHDSDRHSAEERAVASFSRRMMREAHAVTDEEVKHLVRLLGEERVVALVALLAHASFQDRLFLAAGVQVESDGVPPLSVTFAKPEPKVAVHGASLTTGVTPERAGAPLSSDWMALQERLDQQRQREGRIRIPSREEVLKRLGEHHPGAWQAGILWSRVCYGYQPELTDAWFACAMAFRQESKLDRIFEQSIFWVVTRSLQCFY